MSRRFPLLGYPAYIRFWLADAVSMVGSSVAGLALQVLAVTTLRATGAEVGTLNAARWVAISCSACSQAPWWIATADNRSWSVPISPGAVVLGVIPLCAALDVLTLPVLIAVALVFGALSLVYDAAHQSFPPALVPSPLLTSAYARLEQTSAVAQTGGPVVAGALV